MRRKAGIRFVPPLLLGLLAALSLTAPVEVLGQAESPLERWKRIQCERSPESRACQPSAEAPTEAESDESASPAVEAKSGAGEFTATVTPWISQDTPGNRLADRAIFTGEAVAANRPGGRGVELQFCDTGERIRVGLLEKPWKGRIDFHSVNGREVPREVTALAPREYSKETGDRLIYSFLMPVASFKEGTLTLESVGSNFLTGRVRVTYMPSPGALREPPQELRMEVSFRARVVPEVTAETAPACFRT